MSQKQPQPAPIGKMRIVGFLEGVSFVALMGVGLPLKYLWNQPLGVKVAGPIHGALFLWLCLILAQAVFERGWSLKKGAIVFGAALVPFGPFLIDRWLKREQQALDDGNASTSHARA